MDVNLSLRERVLLSMDDDTDGKIIILDYVKTKENDFNGIDNIFHSELVDKVKSGTVEPPY